MSVQFAVLASGSQGNATLIQAEGVGTLLDLGLGPRALRNRLESVGSSWTRIASAILTHTHGDHIDNTTLHRLGQRRIALYIHEGHRSALARHSGFRELDDAGLIRYYDDRPFLTVAGLWVEPLELRHDGGPTYGFRIEAKPRRGRKTVALGYLADTGCWSPAMVEALAEVDVLGVEFNHDVAMQKRSGRSELLIARNLGDWGHLSNDQGAEFVSAVLNRSRPGALRHVVLLHLSRQCNDPKLALQSVRQAIKGRGRRVIVHAAQQSAAHPSLTIEPARRRAAAASVTQARLLPEG